MSCPLCAPSHLHFRQQRPCKKRLELKQKVVEHAYSCRCCRRPPVDNLCVLCICRMRNPSLQSCQQSSSGQLHSHGPSRRKCRGTLRTLRTCAFCTACSTRQHLCPGGSSTTTTVQPVASWLFSAFFNCFAS